MGESGPIDVMHEPIHRAMDMHGVNNKLECFKKIMILSETWLGIVREK
jgi:hypothetical protein